MDKGLRLLGETLSEGFAIGRAETEESTGSRSFRFEYVNPTLARWLGLQESACLRVGGYLVLSRGNMTELYQMGELETALETGSPVTYKVFSIKLEVFLEVLAWPTAQDQFAMVIKKQELEGREVGEAARANRINRFQAEAGLRFLIDNMSDVLWRFDEDFRFTYISASDKIMRGYEPEEVLGRTLWDYMTPDSVEAIRRYQQEVLSRPTMVPSTSAKPREIQMTCRNGQMIWVEVNLTPVYDSHMEMEGFQGIARDITQKRESQNSLIEYRHLMEAVLDNMAQAMIVINSRMEIAAYNKKFLDLFGFDGSEILVGSPFEESFRLWRIRRKTNREAMELDMGTIMANRSYTREYWQMNETGEKVWVQLFHNPLPGGGFVRTYSDITDRKRYELDLYASREKLAVIASIDELTGVLNRRSGFALLRQMEKACLKQHTMFSICFVDIDDLKQVNDRYGHAEGDIFLKTAAELIRSSIRAGDAICRIGGDEFMILFPGCEKRVAERLVNRIQDTLYQTGLELGKPYAMRFSFGIEQMNAEDPITLEELIRRADHLMYQGKSRRIGDLVIE